MNFNNDDPIMNLIVIVKKNDLFTVYYGPTEEWILDHFSSLRPFDELYYEYIDKYKRSFTEVRNAFLVLQQREDFTEHEIKTYFIPSVLLDFDNKLFMSRFFDQPLETRMTADWKGRYKDFLHLIPREFNYWVIDGRDYSEPITND